VTSVLASDWLVSPSPARQPVPPVRVTVAASIVANSTTDMCIRFVLNRRIY
jgi:hypothetical protein